MFPRNELFELNGAARAKVTREYSRVVFVVIIVRYCGKVVWANFRI